MKTSTIIKTIAIAATLCLTACKTSKQAQPTKSPAQIEADSQKARQLEMTRKYEKQYKFITSKVKFTVDYGNQNITLTGSLKMKRDEVVRLQLMAFGFVEAARIEFTPEYVLIMDRINKQFIKAEYQHIDFLRNSGLNFHSLQALFWNELFLPGKTTLKTEDNDLFEMSEEGNNTIVSHQKDKLSYKWLTSSKTGLIKMANIIYSDKYTGNSQLNWDYDNFLEEGNDLYPTVHDITLTLPGSEIKLSMIVNYIKHESDWETRTPIPSKYRHVMIDDMLRRFLAL